MNPFSLRTVIYFAILLIVGDTCLMMRRSNRETVADRACIGMQTFSLACNDQAQRF